MAEDVKEQLLRYLNDAYAAEIGGQSSLKDSGGGGDGCRS